MSESDYLLGPGRAGGRPGGHFRCAEKTYGELPGGFECLPWAGVACLALTAASAGAWYESEAHPGCPPGHHLGAARWLLGCSLIALAASAAKLAFRAGRRRGRAQRLAFAYEGTIHMRPLSPIELDVFLA